MANFKLGDKVRIVKDYPGFDKDCEQSTVGKIGVIKGFHEDGDPKVFFEDIDDFWFYNDECLELIDNDTSPQYTYSDVIIDPSDSRIEIGKEYYFGDNPSCLLKSISQLSAKEGRLVMKDSAIEAQFSPFMSSENEWFVCLIRKKEPTYTERQAQWVMANNIKVGDYVKITRIATTYENGWVNEWDGLSMNPSINKVCEIVDIHDRYGIRLHLGVYNCWFPYFVLEKVEEPEFKVGDFVRTEYETIGVITEIIAHDFIVVRTNNLSYLNLSKSRLEHIKAHLMPFDLEDKDTRNMLRAEWIRPKNEEEMNEAMIVGFRSYKKEEAIDLCISCNGFLSPKDALSLWCFLDGSPCGLVVEDEQ